MSDTPRTDAQEFEAGNYDSVMRWMLSKVVHASFARQLERELDTLKRSLWHQPMVAAPIALPADLVEEIREFLEDYSDVVDGEDGPRPNKAMALLSRIEEEVTR